MYILGLTYLGRHGSSVALLKDGNLIAFGEEERFTRVKFDASFPKNAIDWCLKEAGISIKDVEHAGFFWQPWRGVLSRLRYPVLSNQSFGSLSKWRENARILFNFLGADKILRDQTGFSGKFYYLNHHLTHASCAFFPSGLTNSAILTIDAAGEDITCWMGSGEGNKLLVDKMIKWPNSLGHLYSTVTQYLGFNILTDEHKVMGLAAYGRARYKKEVEKIIHLGKDGTFSLDLSFVSFQSVNKVMYSHKWVSTFGRPRFKNEPITQKHKDIAASFQQRTEEVLFHLVMSLQKRQKTDNLCLAGGVILNAKAVGLISESGLFKNVYTTPVSSDTGCALGAAYYINSLILGRKSKPLRHPYHGRVFTKKSIEQTLKKSGMRYKKLRNVEREAAKSLSEGKIIGWFQGRSEMGERALGDRSILADPRNPDIKEIINSKIKHREEFRPFAPSVLDIYQNDYFEWGGTIPFMTEIHQVKKNKKEIIPAVVHVDGSSRIQTVEKKMNLKFWNLINEFYKFTSVPVVLNTSFNIADEPIVDSPLDALSTFRRSKLDELFIDDYKVENE